MTARRNTLWAYCVLFAAGLAFGQNIPMPDLAGDWNATLEVNGAKLRLVLHVVKTDSGLSAKLDSLDQGALGIVVDTIRGDGSNLHFEMAKLGARFDGDWNPAARRIQGSWVQGSVNLPLSWSPAAAKSATAEQPISAADRLYLLDYLTKTRDGVLQSIQHLTSAQWNWKPDPSRWSIAECVEHLVMEEQNLFRGITQQVIRIPLPDGQARATREQDAQIVRFMTDRTRKIQAGESVQPHGALPTVEEGAARFAKIRDESIEWVRATQIDLRAHGVANPDLHYVDAYGFWILLAAHSARHTAQMEEVKSTPGYPKYAHVMP